jgi:hypothetical protein
MLTIQQSSFHILAANMDITILVRTLNMTLLWLILVKLLDN